MPPVSHDRGRPACAVQDAVHEFGVLYNVRASTLSVDDQREPLDQSSFRRPGLRCSLGPVSGVVRDTAHCTFARREIPLVSSSCAFCSWQQPPITSRARTGLSAGAGAAPAGCRRSPPARAREDGDGEEEGEVGDRRVYELAVVVSYAGRGRQTPDIGSRRGGLVTSSDSHLIASAVRSTSRPLRERLREQPPGSVNDADPPA